VSASHQHSSPAPTRVHDRRHEPPHAGGGLSPTTLTAASLASVVAAVVVSHVWGPGTLYGAAATPIIVAVVSELIQRPRRVIQTARHVRPTRSFDPVAEGRQGLREGDLESASVPPAPERTDHHADGHRLPGGRRGLVIALATGIVAFAIGAFVLTSGELVFGSSQVGGGHSRTTLFGGKPAKKRDQNSQSQSTDKSKTQTDQQSTTKTTKTQQDTTTKTTTPSATQTTTTPRSTTTTAPGAAPSAPGAGGQSPTPSTGQTTTPTPTSTQPSAQAAPPTTTSP